MYQTAIEKEGLYRVGFYLDNMEVGPVPENISSEIKEFFMDFAELIESKVSYTKPYYI